MKFNRICKIVMLVAIAAAGLPRADSTENNDGLKTVKLFVREVPINVLGRTVKVATIDQPNGVQGFNPEKSHWTRPSLLPTGKTSNLSRVTFFNLPSRSDLTCWSRFRRAVACFLF